jgi:small-conductance mechanosensitive channel
MEVLRGAGRRRAAAVSISARGWRRPETTCRRRCRRGTVFHIYSDSVHIWTTFIRPKGEGDVGIVTLLYYVAVAILIGLFGLALGRLVRRLVDRVLFRLGFNDWFRSFNIGKALLRSGYTPSEFFGSVAAWLIYLLFILLAVAYLASNLGNVEVYQWVMSAVEVYLFGFVKFFIISIIGFILVDGFVEYIYKGALSKNEAVVGPVAEYIRIILYLVVVTFALEQGGINVSTLTAMLTPITWGLTAAVVAVLVLEAVRKK